MTRARPLSCSGNESRRPGSKPCSRSVTRSGTRLRLALGAWLLLGFPRLVEACSVCFGNPDSPHTQAVNQAVLFLLAVTGGVLVALAAFFLCLVRRARLAGTGTRSAGYLIGGAGRLAGGADHLAGGGRLAGGRSPGKNNGVSLTDSDPKDKDDSV